MKLPTKDVPILTNPNSIPVLSGLHATAPLVEGHRSQSTRGMKMQSWSDRERAGGGRTRLHGREGWSNCQSLGGAPSPCPPRMSWAYPSCLRHGSSAKGRVWLAPGSLEPRQLLAGADCPMCIQRTHENWSLHTDSIHKHGCGNERAHKVGLEGSAQLSTPALTPETLDGA